MFEQGHFYPSHIRDLVTELQTCEFADSILMKYHCKTISDPTLARIYDSINYPDFNEISSEKVSKIIMNEYIMDFPSIDSDNEGFKGSFSRTFYDNQLSFLSDPIDIGLDYHKQDFFEVTSLNSLWSEDTNATPIKSPLKVNKPSTTLRSKNGLKVLSWKVKEIVEKLGSSTYQEVADCLVKETEVLEVENKDEKNIRRRVYDALNVLIAVGVLQKNGKKVEAMRREASPTIDKLKKLKELSEKYLILKGLIERNKNMKKNFQSLFLPFNVIVVGKKNEKAVKVLADFQKTSVSIRLDQDFFIQSSDEVLKKANFDISYSWLPLELNSLFNIHLYENAVLF